MNALCADGVRPFRLALTIALVAWMCSGCALWPTMALKGSESEGALAAGAKPDDGPKCSDSIPTAKACAHAALEMTRKLEVNAGHWDRGYAYLLVGVATWAATAVKSDSGRSQLLEDLAVGVGALAGIRAVARPDEQREIAQKGRTALRCALGAATDLELLAKKASNEVVSSARASSALSASANANSLDRSKDKVKDDPQNLGADETGATGDLALLGAAIVESRNRADAKSASHEQQLRDDGKSDPERSRLLRSEWVAAERETVAAEATTIRAGAPQFAEALDVAVFDAFAPTGAFSTRNLDINRTAAPEVLFVAGAAKARAAEVALANQRTSAAIADEYENLRFSLTESTLAILQDMTSALSKPVSGIDNLYATQRDSISKIIGQSAATTREQRKETQALGNSLSATPGISTAALTKLTAAGAAGDAAGGKDLEKRVSNCTYDMPATAKE